MKKIIFSKYEERFIKNKNKEIFMLGIGHQTQLI